MKFLLTKELGRLAKWLRILGFDAVYFSKDNKGALVLSSLRDERIILTRNTRLSPFTGFRSIIIKSDFVKEQLEQVRKELKLKIDKEKVFTRCVECNVDLVSVEKGKIKKDVPEYVFKTQDKFNKCEKCSRVYWQGTHWGNVAEYLEKL